MNEHPEALGTIDTLDILLTSSSVDIELAIMTLIQICHGSSQAKGWHPSENEPTFGEQIALIHSEVSEALEAYRDWGIYPNITSGGKTEGVPSELADILIRVFDTAGKQKIDLGRALIDKISFNFTRQHRHGGKAL